MSLKKWALRRWRWLPGSDAGLLSSDCGGRRPVREQLGELPEVLGCCGEMELIAGAIRTAQPAACSCVGAIASWQTATAPSWCRSRSSAMCSNMPSGSRERPVRPWRALRCAGHQARRLREVDVRRSASFASKEFHRRRGCAVPVGLSFVLRPHDDVRSPLPASPVPFPVRRRGGGLYRHRREASAPDPLSHSERPRRDT